MCDESYLPMCKLYPINSIKKNEAVNRLYKVRTGFHISSSGTVGDGLSTEMLIKIELNMNICSDLTDF